MPDLTNSDKLNNYRVVISSDWLKQWRRHELHNVFNQYGMLLLRLKQKAKSLGIQHFWWFLHPTIELTWLSDKPEMSEKFREYIHTFFNEVGQHTFVDRGPDSGVFADWYCNNEMERKFGAIRHSISCDWVCNYIHFKEEVDAGLGVQVQVGRTIHTICNPLGLSYWQEAKICFSRGIICVLFCIFKFKQARWIYRNIFRQRYPG